MKAASIDRFLEDHDPKTWSPPEGTPRGLEAHIWFEGQGKNPLEVALATAERRPKAESVRKLWHQRWNRRPSPVLLVVIYEQDGPMATVCGPTGESPPLLPGIELSQAERLCAAALTEPTPHAAIRFLISMLPEVEADLPGLRNSGMLALQELKHGVPDRPDWEEACKRGREIFGERGRALVERLGFGIDTLSVNSSVLTVKSHKKAVAIFLDEGETFEDSGTRFEGSTPVSHALAQAEREGLPWVVLTRGRQIRLYAARPDVGVGRKGRSETFVELNLALLPEVTAGYLPLLFGADALVEGGSLEEILEESGRFAAGLGARLRERVYYETVPQLAQAVAQRMGEPEKLTQTDLEDAYERTLVILFRILFVAYGEDKNLLPYDTNSLYAAHALKGIARNLTELRNRDEQTFDEHATSLWDDVRALWSAVNEGNDTWDVPRYDGGLFNNEEDVNPAGAFIDTLKLSDAEFGPPLTALLVDEGPDGVIGPVDFRSLSVREFGTIYEGLLESELALAPADLTEDARGNLVPTKKKSEAIVGKGEVYFHHRSGIRKSTGSYFTKPFAVEHLLDHALEPALDEHLARIHELVDAEDDAAAAEVFFDFRCVDIAMGSGHFLVAAVDRIEARLSAFLALHPIPPVLAELERLRTAAYDALGDLAPAYEIEQSSLLRRLVARRCIYGVDLNPIAVELARLAVWIHTFVAGLPLSFLDHNLVHGNSLTGIGTLDEALEALAPEGKGAPSLFRETIEGFLGRAEDALRRLARITEATATDIEAEREAHDEAMEKVEPARNLFDLIVAARLDEAQHPEAIEEAALDGHRDLRRAREVSAELDALHLPVAFPEVFLRERPGFDCIIGNPPWEKTHVEEHGFWALRFPQLRSLPVAKMNRRISALKDDRPDLLAEYERSVVRADAMRQVLLAGPYPGMGSGHPDLYKAFCWRFWQLARKGGRIGVVLPRSALSAKGSAEWRMKVLDEGTFEDVTMLLNNTKWVFPDVHPQYTIGLVSVLRDPDRSGLVRLRGPYPSLDALLAGAESKAAEIPAADFLDWSEGAAFPLLPTPGSLTVFRKLRAQPNIVSSQHDWKTRAVQGDLNSTTGKKYMEFDPPGSSELWPVYKGASFDIWDSDTGEYYAWIDPETATHTLQERRLRSASRSNSVFAEFDSNELRSAESLPCLRARVAFRRITRSTDSRTMRAALVPPKVVLTDVAPYLLWPVGDERDEAFLLGVFCSLIFDWSARRYVETHMDFHVLDHLSVPYAPREHELRCRVEEVAGRLAAVDSRYATWAKAVGVPVGSVDNDEAPELVAELDATVAHLYGLTQADVLQIFETFHTGWDPTERLERVLAHYRSLG